MTLVNAETGEIVAYCTHDEARALTDQIKGASETVWSLMLEAHDRKAWAALDYARWEDYVRAEFGMSRTHSYAVLDQARAVKEIEAASGVSYTSDMTVRDAREIKPNLKAVAETIKERIAEEAVREAPERVKEIVKEVIAEERAKPAPNTRTRRTPLSDDARSAGWELRKAIERIERVVNDDRFASNREEVAAHLSDHLAYAVEVGTGLANRLKV